MLKKLQQKLILIIMCLVGVVLLVSFGMVVATTYHREMQQVSHTLNRALRIMESKAGLITRSYDALFNNGGSSQNENQTTYANVLDEDGNTMGSSYDSYSGQTTLSSTELEHMNKKAFAAAASTGRIDDMYYKKETFFGKNLTVVAYTNAYPTRSAILSTVTWCATLFCGSMVVLFLISCVLAKLAVRPVQKAWTQQQQFLADASHELKTPLTVILANNDILLAHQKDTVQAQSKWVESTKAEATHMKNLVNSLLYLARSDASQSTPVMSAVPLGEITMNIALQFEPVAFDKGLELDYTDIDTTIRIEGDATKLNQLLHILVDNACKYGKGGGTVDLHLQRNNGGARLMVHNGGKPIDPEDLPHIFERFYRSDKARTQKNQEGGYGLGLAIAKSIVEDHHGKISVTSTKESGTTFTVQFKERSR